MRIFRKSLPERLPKKPALLFEGDGYAVWTGRSWWGHLGKVDGGWELALPNRTLIFFSTFRNAVIEAENQANRAEGRHLYMRR